MGGGGQGPGPTPLVGSGPTPLVGSRANAPGGGGGGRVQGQRPWWGQGQRPWWGQGQRPWWGQGHFKHALVKPLVKKVSLDPNCLKHYRPVSNLLFLSKALERIVLKQFLQHLQSHSLLEPFQSAYRKCHSTETALLRVVNDLLQASDSGRVSILSLLDLSAAFDTTDLNNLITRLRSTFGCSGTVLNWFISYLSNRDWSYQVP